MIVYDGVFVMSLLRDWIDGHGLRQRFSDHHWSAEGDGRLGWQRRADDRADHCANRTATTAPTAAPPSAPPTPPTARLSSCAKVRDGTVTAAARTAMRKAFMSVLEPEPGVGEERRRAEEVPGRAGLPIACRLWNPFEQVTLILCHPPP
jgi:hypothetical protein